MAGGQPGRRLTEAMDNLIADVIGDVALVLVASALLGAVARRFGQPTVVGQILAGLLLGPTLLGRFPGHLTSRLFPHAAVGYLTILAQVAVVIFMFTVGYELRWPSQHGRGRAPLMVAAAALLVPMALGTGAVLTFRPLFLAAGQPRITTRFVLFMAVAVSITALPVLAAIVRERRIAGTVPGVVATSAAGVMDAVAWLALAAVLAGTAGKSGRPWPVASGLLAAFAAAMLLVVRPALKWWFGRRGAILANQLPAAVMLTLGAAWVTTSLGVHPMFGGLIAGLTMPRDGDTPDAEILRRMEDLGGILLPLFFAVTGLSTNVGAIGGNGVLLLVLVCAVAVAGKLGPGYAASRLGGLPRREAATVAALVNTRGLTELIALNAGLAARLIDDRVFSVLVIQALLTTIATAPLLRLTRAPGGHPPDDWASAEAGDLSTPLT